MEDLRKFLITQLTDLSNGDLKTTILEFLHEKLTLLLHFITTILNPTDIVEFLHEKLTLLFHFITTILNPKDIVEFLNFLHEKLALFLHLITTTFANLSQQFDQIFPPETRSETIHRWIHIALTRALPILLVGFIVFKCCSSCCRRSRGYGRMMVAPGRGGVRMPRASFEAGPRDYFFKLRARKPLVY